MSLGRSAIACVSSWRSTTRSSPPTRCASSMSANFQMRVISRTWNDRASSTRCSRSAWPMSDRPAVVDVEWLQQHLGDGDLFLGDVRGPNAHARGHIPRSRPLVLGSPPPMSDAAMLEALAPEVGLRLRRHGVTGGERLVLYDRGDGVGAMPAAQMAELAGHPRVAVLLGGIAAWRGDPEVGPVELHPVKTSFDPDLHAVPTRQELAARLDDASLVILDVRTDEEFRVNA